MCQCPAEIVCPQTQCPAKKCRTVGHKIILLLKIYIFGLYCQYTVRLFGIILWLKVPKFGHSETCKMQNFKIFLPAPPDSVFLGRERGLDVRFTHFLNDRLNSFSAGHNVRTICFGYLKAWKLKIHFAEICYSLVKYRWSTTDRQTDRLLLHFSFYLFVFFLFRRIKMLFSKYTNLHLLQFLIKHSQIILNKKKKYL